MTETKFTLNPFRGWDDSENRAITYAFLVAGKDKCIYTKTMVGKEDNKIFMKILKELEGFGTIRRIPLTNVWARLLLKDYEKYTEVDAKFKRNYGINPNQKYIPIKEYMINDLKVIEAFANFGGLNSFMDKDLFNKYRK
jgi:hypothetical protein